MAIVTAGLAMLNVTELNCFVAAAEEVHFGRAAARLNMTQPTLSRQIDALERTLGVKLFERANRRVTLTMAGRIFLPEAKRILVQIENATNLARRTWRGEAGVLRLGYTATAAFVDLPLILNRAAKMLPDVKILLKESVSSMQKDALLADMLDVGIMRPPVDRESFGIIPLRKERFIAALHSGDARVAKSKLTLRDFDKRPFIMYSADGAGYSFRILTACSSRRRSIRNSFTTWIKITRSSRWCRRGLAPRWCPIPWRCSPFRMLCSNR